MLPALLAATPAAAQVTTDEAAWINVTIQGPVRDRLVYFVEVQPRINDDVSRLGQLVTRAAIGWKLDDTVTLYQGYGRIIDYIPGGDMIENRSFQQVTWTVARGRLGELQSRTRLEQRFVEGSGEMGLRLRQMARWELPLRKAPRRARARPPHRAPDLPDPALTGSDPDRILSSKSQTRPVPSIARLRMRRRVAISGGMATLLDPSARGRVILVGAGPGDPGLLTVRAVAALEAADVVVHDGLIDPRVLDLAPAGAQRISVAKQRARHTLPQEAINALIVAHVKTGAIVVRLKGGDPFIFGRGGEEVEAVRAAGLPVEVIPGVSAALGCAAEAMLPLTHRDHSSAVSFVAGQCKGLADQDWAGLAGQGRTLVIYMGVATAADIADKLMADGVAPDMPVAVLEKGTLAGHRALRTLLADLGPMVTREQVQSPAIIVVGEVVELSDAEDKLARWARAAESMSA